MRDFVLFFDGARGMAKMNNLKAIFDDSYEPQRQDYCPLLVSNRKFRDVCFNGHDP